MIIVHIDPDADWELAKRGLGPTWYDECMFHGDQWPTYRRFDSRVLPRPTLRLWRNVHHLPKVFHRGDLIVANSIARKLIAQGVPCQPVEFTKCFDLPYTLDGSMPPPPKDVWPESAEYYDEFIPYLPDCPPPVEAYFELTPRRLVDVTTVPGRVSPEVLADMENQLHFGPDKNLERMDPSVFEAHPFVWCNGVFARLDIAMPLLDAIDPRFFKVTAFRI